MSTKYQLPNGLSVILNQSNKSPVISVQMWVKTGSADEAKGEEGISHFIEHLVFKGSRNFGVGEIASVVEGSGGEFNAYTSFDQTVFYVTISKEFSDVGLMVISEMMGYPTFIKEEIDNEREVVIEEIKRGQDSAGRCASRLMFETAYKGHPYSIPVIGYDKNIRKISRKKIVDYYQSRYVPDNMFLVVSGDFEKPEIKKNIKKYFGDFESFKLRKVKRKKETPQEKVRIKVEESKFEETQINMGWKIPKVSHKDIPALDLLALILGQGESSRLTKRLRLQNHIANYAYAGTFNPLEKGLFVVSAGLRNDKIEPTLEIISEELEKICTELVTSQELEKAITNIESDEYYGMETVDGLSRKHGQLEFLLGDHKYFPKYMKAVYAVTREDLLRVARKYLKTKNLSFTVLNGEGLAAGEVKKLARKATKKLDAVLKKSTKKQTTKEETGSVAKRKRRKIKTSSKPASGTRVVQLKTGGKIIFHPTSETPTFSVRSVHLGGIRAESDDNQGITELISRCWTTGSEQFSEDQIKNQLDDWASSLHAFGGKNTMGLTADGLKSFEKECAGLYQELLTSPSFAESAIEREKSVMRQLIKARDDNPAQVAILKFMQEVFQGHPYSRDPKGTVDSLNNIGHEHLTEHWRRLACQKNFITVVCGDVDTEMWQECINGAVEKLNPKGYDDLRFEHIGPENHSQHFIELQKEQTHIVTGVQGLTFKSPQKYALELLQAILSGQGGRLFVELRDKNSLAYSVAPLKMDGIDTGYFGAYIGCSPEKGKKAIEMLNIEFQKLVDTPVELEELERSKRYLIGRHDIDLQKNSAIANSILFDEIYDIHSDELHKYANYINSVTADDIQNLAKELFSRNSVTVAVGAESPF